MSEEPLLGLCESARITEIYEKKNGSIRSPSPALMGGLQDSVDCVEIPSKKNRLSEPENAPPAYYGTTEECTNEIMTLFQTETGEFPSVNNIIALLRRIFDEQFVAALATRSEDLHGLTVYLPLIFPDGMLFDSTRFQFSNDN